MQRVFASSEFLMHYILVLFWFWDVLEFVIGFSTGKTLCPWLTLDLTVDLVCCTKYKPALGGLEVFQEPVESSSVLQGAAKQPL